MLKFTKLKKFELGFKKFSFVISLKGTPFIMNRNFYAFHSEKLISNTLISSLLVFKYASRFRVRLLALCSRAKTSSNNFQVASSVQLKTRHLENMLSVTNPSSLMLPINSEDQSTESAVFERRASNEVSQYGSDNVSFICS